MSTEVKVPTLGESVTEATIGEWLKQPGDPVAVDQTWSCRWRLRRISSGRKNG